MKPESSLQFSFAAGLLFLLLFTFPTFAAQVPIERGAILFKTDDDSRRFAQMIANIVIVAGYDCGSISVVLPLFTKQGFYIRCNNNSKAYSVERARDGGRIFRVTPQED